MIIGGFQKNSMIDFPGRISSIVFTGGCNFRCPYCHNPSLVDGTFEQMPESEIFEYLEKRAGLIEGVVVTGGEPTLNNDLPSFVETIKSIGYDVKLDTNGSRPDVLKRTIDSGSLSYIAMDIKAPLNFYPENLTDEKCIEEKLKESIKLIMDSGIDYEFRITCAKPFATEENFTEILESIKGAEKLFLQKLVTKNMLDEEFKNAESPDLIKLKEIAEAYVKHCEIR